MATRTQLALLGTNGWYDTQLGSTICLLIKTDRFSVILDAGLGISKLDEHPVADKPAYLFLSHYHLDHIYGLHVLAKFAFKQGLTIFGQPGIEEDLRRILTPPFTIAPEQLPYQVSFREVPRDAPQFPFGCQTAALRHAAPTIGARLELNGLRIAFVPDTGYCENAVKLARGADLLLTECAHAPGEENGDWPHLNPETAARIAVEAGAKRLLLVHFAPTNYPTADKRREAEAVARRIFPATDAGFDGMELDLAG